MRMRKLFLASALAVGAALCLPTSAVQAQGRGHGHGHGGPPGLEKKGGMPPGLAKKREHAIYVTRDVLDRHGYAVVRVEEHGDARWIFYKPKHRKHARVSYLIIRPDDDYEEDRIVVVDAPRPVLLDINIQLR